MKVLVAGTGHVGATTALVFAEMGLNVTGLDTDQHKISQLQQGSIPFYEPGLERLLYKHLQAGNIQFTADTEAAIRSNDFIFICVGTPSRDDGSANLQAIRQLAEDIGRNMNGYKLVVNKSTVPVGTQEKVTRWIRAAQASPCLFDVVSNPEFLREGRAVSDALHPDRIVIGSNSDHAAQLLKLLYIQLNCPIIVTSPRTAEMIKYAANAFLATKISYINELANLCDKLNMNVKEVAHAIGLDPRIGSSFLQAGIGYGGSCFPKDVSALLNMAAEHNAPLTLLEQADSVNRKQYLQLLDKARLRLGSLQGKKAALLGIAFKPDTDDIREAPAIRIMKSLLLEQAVIRVHDPAAKLPPELMGDAVTVCSTPEQALQGADAVFLCTEWKLYQQLDWLKMKGLMQQPNLFDGRNMLDAAELQSAGYFYQGVGYC